MRNPYLEYNPVFESIAQQARKYKGAYINEDALAYEGEKSQKYLKLLIDSMTSRITKFTVSIPDKTIRDSILQKIKEGYENLAKSSPANLDEFLVSVNNLFNGAYEGVKASSLKEKLIPIFDKVKEGMDLLINSYENLKKKYPNEMTNSETLGNAKKFLTDSINSFTATLEELKKAK